MQQCIVAVSLISVPPLVLTCAQYVQLPMVLMTIIRLDDSDLDLT